MIFPNLEIEDVLQVNDKTRLNGTKSFISKDNVAVTLVRIKPEASGSFIDVTGAAPINSNNWFLDWQYATAGAKVVEIEITAGSVVTLTGTITVVSVVDDYLFSSDKDLVGYENAIMKWTPVGRNSWLNIHRKAQTLILDWLDSIRVWKQDGTRIAKADFLVTNDVRQLSAYWALQLIFEDLSNKPDDVFKFKADTYSELVLQAKNRGRIQADFNDNQVDDGVDEDSQDMRTFTMVRR
jgi:hypothetical protein